MKQIRSAGFLLLALLLVCAMPVWAEESEALPNHPETVNELESAGPELIYCEEDASEYVYQDGSYKGVYPMKDAFAIATISDADEAGAKSAIIAGVRAYQTQIDLSGYRIPKSDILRIYTETLL